MTTSLPSPTSPSRLEDLSEDERNEAFDRLQQRLPAVWRAMRANDPRESVVVVPSMSIDRMVPGSGASNQALEERSLFMLLLLRQPRLKLVYVTSMPVDPAVIEYYLSLLPGVIPSHARARLSLVSVGDSSATPLTEKLLARPRLVEPDPFPHPRPGFLAPGALQHDHATSGTSPCCSGSRCTARTHATSPSARRPALARRLPRRGSRIPMGVNDVRSVDDVVTALSATAGRAPQSHRRDGQAQRGRVRAPATPRSTSRGCPPAATTRSAMPCATAS